MRTEAELKIAIAAIDDDLAKIEGKTDNPNAIKRRHLLAQHKALTAQLTQERLRGQEAIHDAPRYVPPEKPGIGTVDVAGPLWSVLGNLCPCANDGTKSHGEYCVRGAGAKLPGTPPRTPESPEMQRLKTEPVESLCVPTPEILILPYAPDVEVRPDPPKYQDPAVQELAKASAKPKRLSRSDELTHQILRLRRVAEEIHRWAGGELPVKVRHALEDAIKQAGGEL